MWNANSTSAFYSGFNSGLSKHARKNGGNGPPRSSPSQAESPSDQFTSFNASELLGPAVEGPPSPERLRQISQQFRRASHLHREQGHRANSSASSSLTSLTGDLSTWERDLENMTQGLSRRPSNRSATSTSPSTDRTDGVQVFGRTLFHRRGKSTRETESQSSSNSSVYSADVPVDNASTTFKDSFIPSLFTRRKPSRDESVVQKRPQISVPFNFQHVTHTNRDKLPQVQEHEIHVDLPLHLPSMQLEDSINAATVSQRTSQLPNFHFRNISSDSGDGQRTSTLFSRPTFLPRNTTPTPGTRRHMQQARSQDQLRVMPSGPAPPRPPRSPIWPTVSPPLPPSPPPRGSSRQSMNRNDHDGLTTQVPDRPQTSSGFRQAQPYSPSVFQEPLQSPTLPDHYMTYMTYNASIKSLAASDGGSSQGTITVPDGSWPLSGPSSGAALADVPEEDEHALNRRSRLSMSSNKQSLRASQSVPMLRSLAQLQRPMSGASETLGSSATVSTQMAAAATMPEGQQSGGGSSRESWEDDIDYCYEHEVEANCDYQWERSSMDTTRDDNRLQAHAHVIPSCAALPVLLQSISSLDVSTPNSPTNPTIANVHRIAGASNFSLPRSSVGNGRRPSVLKSVDRASYASSFKESHGFNLSPSLLIPADYQQELAVSEVGRYDHHTDGEIASLGHQTTVYGDGTLQVDDIAALQSPQRSSTSTTSTLFTSRSNSTGDRHKSTNSTWTTLTTHSTSSTSLNQLAGPCTEAAEPVPTLPMSDATRDAESLHPFPATRLDSVTELALVSQPLPSKKPNHRSHASESVTRGDGLLLRSQETARPRRPRARTSSLSTQSPPVGQYALFPRGQVQVNGEQI